MLSIVIDLAGTKRPLSFQNPLSTVVKDRMSIACFPDGHSKLIKRMINVRAAQ